MTLPKKRSRDRPLHGFDFFAATLLSSSRSTTLLNATLRPPSSPLPLPFAPSAMRSTLLSLLSLLAVAAAAPARRQVQTNQTSLPATQVTLIKALLDRTANER